MKKFSLASASFIQAAGLVAYVAFITLFVTNVENWIGSIRSPILPLSLLVLSALACGLISLAYPIFLIWEKKQTAKGLKLVVYTALWLLLFISVFLAYLATAE